MRLAWRTCADKWHDPCQKTPLPDPRRWHLSCKHCPGLAQAHAVDQMMCMAP